MKISSKENVMEKCHASYSNPLKLKQTIGSHHEHSILSIQFHLVHFSCFVHLTHWGRVAQIHNSKLGLYWFRQWLVTSLTSNHYLNQCWHIVDRIVGNKFKWNLNHNTAIFIEENNLKMLSAKWRPFFLGLNVLRKTSTQNAHTHSYLPVTCSTSHRICT